MPESASDENRFAAGEATWLRRLGALHDVVRCRRIRRAVLRQPAGSHAGACRRAGRGAAALTACGAEVIGWYGVRLFTDHWTEADIAEDLPGLLTAEQEAGRRDPFRALAGLTHTIARVG